MPRKDPKDPNLATNRKAFHDYNVLERFEAGIQLVGTEVKSCRARSIQLQEGFVKIEKNQALLYNVHICVKMGIDRVGTFFVCFLFYCNNNYKCWRT